MLENFHVFTTLQQSKVGAEHSQVHPAVLTACGGPEWRLSLHVPLGRVKRRGNWK